MTDTTPLARHERDALRREIGPETDRDRAWQPMVSAAEVRALLDAADEADRLTEHSERVEAYADALIAERDAALARIAAVEAVCDAAFRRIAAVGAVCDAGARAALNARTEGADT